MSLLELLKAGEVEAFNARRGKRSAPDFFAADLSGLKLPGVDLSGVNLEKADLSGTDLSGAVLFKTRLAGADLSGTVLRDVMALRSRWREAYLEEAVLDGGDFTSADFTEAEWVGVSAVGAVFGGARLVRVSARSAVLDRADLSEARLAEADLEGAHLSGAVLTEAKLSGTRLVGAHLDGADLSRVRGAGADFSRADLSGARLLSADLTGAKLEGADLSGADLSRADLGQASLEGAVLEGADLSEAGLEGQDLEELGRRGAALGAAARSPFPDAPAAFHFEDVAAAISGDRLGVLWENDEDGEHLAMRVAVAPLDGAFSGEAPAAATPPDLTLARALVSAPGGGFIAAAVVERPGGITMELTPVGADGALGAPSSLGMEYRPAVRPVVVEDGEGFLIYGLGRDGPTLMVHRFEGGALSRLYGARITNARGFVGWRQPALVTKGGVVRAVTREGVGGPLAVPESFPGRAAAACMTGDRLWLAWTPRGENGFRWLALDPGGEQSGGRAVPRCGITALDLAAVDGGAVAVYAREQGGTGAAGIWVRRLGSGEDVPVLVDEVIDIEEIRVVGVADKTLSIVATTITEELLLLEVAGAEVRVRCQLP